MHENDRPFDRSRPTSTGPSGAGNGGPTTRRDDDDEPHGGAARVMEHAGSRAQDAGERIRARAGRAGEAMRTRLADELRCFADAGRSAADQLADEDHDRVGRHARSVTESFDEVADYLEHADLSQVGEDAAGFARRHPAMFLGGLAVAGFAVGRLLSARPISPEPAPPRASFEPIGTPPPTMTAPPPFPSASSRGVNP